MGSRQMKRHQERKSTADNVCVKADMGKCLTLKSKEKTYVGRAPQRTGIGEAGVIGRDQREWDFADSAQRSFLLLLLQELCVLSPSLAGSYSTFRLYFLRKHSPIPQISSGC